MHGNGKMLSVDVSLRGRVTPEKAYKALKYSLDDDRYFAKILQRRRRHRRPSEIKVREKDRCEYRKEKYFVNKLVQEAVAQRHRGF